MITANKNMTYKEYIATVKKANKFMFQEQSRIRTLFIDWEHSRYTDSELLLEVTNQINYVEKELEKIHVDFTILKSNISNVPTKSAEEQLFMDLYSTTKIIESYLKELPELHYSVKEIYGIVNNYL